MIPVTKTFLPPLIEYETILKQAWDKQWITNRGDLTLMLEDKLRNYLDVTNIIVTNNGTIPIQIALKLLGLGGEIITTPFSYVATTSAIVWENCTPIFVDIHPEYLTIDEEKIESAITSKTTAILATHVFGNPCNVERIDAIAKKHNLKVIYDGAHCFGVKYKGQSIFNYGDISTCSFHATKLFHTGEGGAVFCKEEELFHKLFYSHNFGHNGPLDFYGLGINGKISELQSAMGLTIFPYMNYILTERKIVIDFYNEQFNHNLIKKLRIREHTEWNNSYYPIIFKNEEILLKVQDALNSENIFPRRYFYPSLNTIDYAKGNKMPIAESISKTILCLPLYIGLDKLELKRICDIIKDKIC